MTAFSTSVAIHVSSMPLQISNALYVSLFAIISFTCEYINIALNRIIKLLSLLTSVLYRLIKNERTYINELSRLCKLSVPIWLVKSK